MKAVNVRPERRNWKLLSPADLGPIHVSNRLIRSATWDPRMIHRRSVDDADLRRYRDLALGGVGTIIVGDFNVVPRGGVEARESAAPYEDIRVRGFRPLVEEVKKANPLGRIVAQVSAALPGAAPSAVPDPLMPRTPRELSPDEIHRLPHLFAVAIEGVKNDGFDGAQLHACHGGLLSRFLSPYSNRRMDAYGRDASGRCRLLVEILDALRDRVGGFPILIKMNGTDDVQGGIDEATAVRQAALLAEAGFDAIEVSGSMKEALARSEAELGFRPVLSPESRTGIGTPEKQSYYLPIARAIRRAVDVPVILVGGNRDIERLETIVGDGDADFIAMSRPFIREPGLVRRWQNADGSTLAACVSCNACIYDMYVNGRVRCLVREEPELLPEARRWLTDWTADRVSTQRSDSERRRA